MVIRLLIDYGQDYLKINKLKGANIYGEKSTDSWN